jgi:hypothetical protein
VAVTVPLLDSPIQAMNCELGPLVSADLPSGINCLLLGIEVPTAPTSTAPFDVPTTFRVWDYMVGIQFLGHVCLILK